MARRDGGGPQARRAGAGQVPARNAHRRSPIGPARRCPAASPRPTSTRSRSKTSRRSPATARIERKIKSIVRWNAMAMVLKANKNTNVGGHIRTFASAATLYEIGFNHFFRGRTDRSPRRRGLLPGPRQPRHVRAGLRRRAARRDAARRTSARNCKPGGGVSSYPHPWLMPDFWQYPTVSMGLGPIMSIYHARYNRYLRDRDLAKTDDARVWAFLGDGECDEPESLGCDQPRRPREARQPHVGHQLQPAAARRPGPRQRQDHPGTRRRLPRGRVERHQGGLGQRLGRAAEATTTPARSPAA